MTITCPEPEAIAAPAADPQLDAELPIPGGAER
jgi:hypothetical protein